MRFCAGLVKKLFFADALLLLHRDFLDGSTCLSAVMALFAYTLYVYFDFSGYSDMALGSAGIFGFSLAENFSYPYISRSVCAFFGRWHISLGRWFRDYMYIPLGGSARGLPRQLFALAASLAFCRPLSWSDALLSSMGTVLLCADRAGKVCSSENVFDRSAWNLFTRFARLDFFLLAKRSLCGFVCPAAVLRRRHAAVLPGGLV